MDIVSILILKNYLCCYLTILTRLIIFLIIGSLIVNIFWNELFLFNNKLINEHKSEWFSQIGYIQQNVFLIDNTLASNIAFGIEKGKIDYKKLNTAILQANLLDFVNKLPNGAVIRRLLYL